MAVQPIQIAAPQWAYNAKTKIYTAPAGTRVRIDYCAWTNIDPTTSGNTVQFSLFIGPPGASERILNKTVLVHETYLCPEAIGALLIGGDEIHIVASAKDMLFGQINGVTFT